MRLTALVLVALPIVLGLYSYIVYPAILRLMALGTRRASARPLPAQSALPLVTVVVPAYNEETQIRGAIEALLAQTYPHERMQILILSDASTDATDSIVAEYASQGVELMRMPARSGKTAIENAAIPLIRGDVVLNSDSSTRLHRDATRSLVEQLADPEIGVVRTRRERDVWRHLGEQRRSGVRRLRNAAPRVGNAHWRHRRRVGLLLRDPSRASSIADSARSQPRLLGAAYRPRIRAACGVGRCGDRLRPAHEVASA
jgi:cellulose synthase/poly-beta-1,6-N-acetylglucosamine synthase-like glycosyltransferase